VASARSTAGGALAPRPPRGPGAPIAEPGQQGRRLGRGPALFQLSHQQRQRAWPRPHQGPPGLVADRRLTQQRQQHGDRLGGGDLAERPLGLPGQQIGRTAAGQGTQGGDRRRRAQTGQRLDGRPPEIILGRLDEPQQRRHHPRISQRAQGGDCFSSHRAIGIAGAAEDGQGGPRIPRIGQQAQGHQPHRRGVVVEGSGHRRERRAGIFVGQHVEGHQAHRRIAVGERALQRRPGRGRQAASGAQHLEARRAIHRAAREQPGGGRVKPGPILVAGQGPGGRQTDAGIQILEQQPQAARSVGGSSPGQSLGAQQARGPVGASLVAQGGFGPVLDGPGERRGSSRCQDSEEESEHRSIINDRRPSSASGSARQHAGAGRRSLLTLCQALRNAPEDDARDNYPGPGIRGAQARGSRFRHSRGAGGHLSRLGAG
jgi:hypothetical protein